MTLDKRTPAQKRSDAAKKAVATRKARLLAESGAGPVAVTVTKAETSSEVLHSSTTSVAAHSAAPERQWALDGKWWGVQQDATDEEARASFARRFGHEAPELHLQRGVKFLGPLTLEDAKSRVQSGPRANIEPATRTKTKLARRK